MLHEFLSQVLVGTGPPTLPKTIAAFGKCFALCLRSMLVKENKSAQLNAQVFFAWCICTHRVGGTYPSMGEPWDLAQPSMARAMAAEQPKNLGGQPGSAPSQRKKATAVGSYCRCTTLAFHFKYQPTQS